MKFDKNTTTPSSIANTNDFPKEMNEIMYYLPSAKYRAHSYFFETVYIRRHQSRGMGVYTDYKVTD